MFKNHSPGSLPGTLWFLLSGRVALTHLLRLENAVTYYGGGWDQLALRALERDDEVRVVDERIARLLDDVAQYLQDVALAGNLPVTDWRNDLPVPRGGNHDRT
ncbi:hypothetical protein JBO41_09735 [Enterobacter asburiae]|uniref:hypothetical protein n=1 Tax=Enterobacter asburiae TaxID=61645 RepID=UPI00192C45B8|nr:hypothetical protein [Enterobacter asburiae]MBL5841179.1 hypothetical protein [Enterobacter asburiae]MBL5912407.1 hypothetical protein [Enterobacter asburiae]MBL5916916.1 hypothetical protein [Enterobacter asburiae]MBL5941547.1 hypothetical protein [Enterobacter asburiae]MBL5972015.1 hypothetical protein [Enterobacter asburiae]